MHTATAIAKQPQGPFIDEVVLDYDHRHRRRIVLKGEGGHQFLLDLGEVPDLRDGDGIVLDNGQIVLVRAAPEALLEIHAHGAIHMARLAWHIGNRHLAAEIGEHSIRIRADHVIAQMVEGLGGHVHAIEAPFNPEGGAYGGPAPAQEHAHIDGHSHHHDPGHSHG
jgi:urease accessory protein